MITGIRSIVTIRIWATDESMPNRRTAEKIPINVMIKPKNRKFTALASYFSLKNSSSSIDDAINILVYKYFGIEYEHSVRYKTKHLYIPPLYIYC